MKSIKCAFHPTETIVNFCRNEECLLPMCPTCIKVHTKQHMNENSHGLYDNIIEVFQEVGKSLEDVQNALKSCQDEVKEMRTMKENRKEITKKKMHEMRMKVLDTINKFIDSLEKEIGDGLTNAESILEEDFISVEEIIDETMKEIKKQSDNLHGEKTLKTIINHFSSDKAGHYEQIINELGVRIQDMNTTGITISKEFKLNQISEVLKTIRGCYRNVFVETLNRKSLKSIDWKELNVSKVSQQEKNTARNMSKCMSDS